MSQQINLFNPIFLKQKKYFSAVTMAQALGLILIGCVLVSVYAHHSLKVLKKEADDTSAKLLEVQMRRDKVSQAYGVQQGASTEEQIHKAEIEVKKLQQVFGTLQREEIGNTKGYGDYMRAFARQIVNGVWLTGFSISDGGNEIGLQGRALQPEFVPDYITRLKREPVLQGKSFAALIMQVPQVDPDEQKNQTAQADVKPQASLAYINFSLQSSGAVKEQAASSGEKSK